MSSPPLYMKPAYQIVFYSSNAATLGFNSQTIKHQFGRFANEDYYNEPQVSSWNIKF